MTFKYKVGDIVRVKKDNLQGLLDFNISSSTSKKIVGKEGRIIRKADHGHGPSYILDISNTWWVHERDLELEKITNWRGRFE